MECPKCKSEIDNDSRYCDQCGEELHFCSVCGRVGKGNRCIHCGGIMIGAEEHYAKASSPLASGLQASSGISSPAPVIHLVNDRLSINLSVADGAILGRRNGPYAQTFSQFGYISGTHAQISYSGIQGWTIIDRNSTNGTKVEGEPLKPGIPCALHNGSSILLANVELIAKIDN